MCPKIWVNEGVQIAIWTPKIRDAPLVTINSTYKNDAHEKGQPSDFRGRTIRNDQYQALTLYISYSGFEITQNIHTPS